MFNLKESCMKSYAKKGTYFGEHQSLGPQLDQFEDEFRP